MDKAIDIAAIAVSLAGTAAINVWLVSMGYGPAVQVYCDWLNLC